MSTEVYLGTLQASNSLKSLKTVVNSVTASWKAQTNALRSSGDSLKAAETKYNGLAKSIKANQDVINNLREKQKGLDQTTQDGARQYAKYQAQIDKTQNRITSLTRQQEKAGTSLRGYKSGVIQLQQSIKQSNEVTESYVNKLKAQGREVGAQQQKLVGLRRTMDETRSVYRAQATELERNRQNIRTLSTQYEKAKTSLKQMEAAGKQNSDAYKQQSQNVANLKAKLSAANEEEAKQSIRLNKTAESLAKNGKKMKALNRTVGGLSVSSARAVDRLNKVGGAAKVAGDKMIGLGQRTSGATMAIGAGMAYGVKKAMELQHTYKETTNLLVTSGEKQAEAQANVNKMRRQGAKLSTQYGKSQKSIADGYQELVKRGYTSKMALGAMKSILQASVASGDDFNDTMHSATGTLEAFGLKTNNTAKMIKNSKVVVNEMAYAADATSTDFQSLGKAMEYTGSTAHAAGYSLAQTSAAIGILSNNNLEADKAGTGLRKTINSLVSPTTAASHALKKIGVDTKDFIDKSGKLKSMSTIFGMLGDKMKGMSKAQKVDLMHTVFGTTGQQAALILSENAKALGKLNTQVERSSKQKGGGYVQRLADKNMKSAQSNLQRAKQSSEAIAITLGSSLLPTVNKILLKVVHLADQFSKLSPNTKKWVTYIGLAVAALSPLSFVLGGVLKSVRLITSGLGLAIKTVGKVKEFTSGKSVARAGEGATGLLSGLKSSKGLLGGLASGKGAMSGLKAIGESGGVKGVLKGLGKGALSATPINALLSATELIGMNKKNAGTKIGRAGGSFAGGAAGAAIGTAILPGIGTVLGGIGGTLLGTKLGGAIGKGIQKATKDWGKWIKKAFTGNLGWEKSIGKAIGNVTKSIVNGAKSWGKALGKVFKNVGKFFSPLVDGAKKAIGAVGKVIRGAAGIILKALKYALVIPIGLVVGLAVIAFKKLSKPIENVAKSLGKTLKKVWNSIAKTTKSIFGGIGKTIKGVWNSISSATSKAWKAIRKHVVDPVISIDKAIVKYIKKAIVNTVKGAWNGIKSATAKTWKTVKKYVVDPVVAIDKAIVKYIKKAIVGTVKSAWNGIKSATSKAWKTVKKYVIEPVVDIDRAIVKYLRKGIVNTVKTAWNLIKKATSSAWDIIYKYVANPIKKMYLTVHKWLDKIKWYWFKIWNSVVKFTSNIWTSIKKKVAGGLSAIAKVINTGIKAINWVISKFGGKKTTIGYLPTHYATGTGAVNGGKRRPITKPTYAMLNDGNDSPETGNRELAVLPDGTSFMPKEKNWTGVVPAGTEVMNASETKQLFHSAGITHFADGTGLLGNIGSWIGDKVSGAVDGIKNAFGSMKSLVSTAGKILAHPVDSLKNFFTDKLNFKGITGDVQQGLAGMFKGNVVKQAKSWWGAVWDLINGAIGAGGDDAGGAVTHSPGKGWVVTSGFGNRGAVAGGFSQHDGVDFSGAKVVHAMNTGVVSHAGGAPAGWGGANGIGENIVIGGGGLNYIYQELNGKYNSGAKLLVGKGDHVKAGQAIAELGAAGTHVHVGATKHPMFSIGGSSTKGWLDPTKITSSAKSDDSNKDKSPKASGALQKFVKNQLGSGLFSWIAKHLAPLTDSFGGSVKGNYDPDMIRKAAEAMHVNPSDSYIKLLQAVIQSESGGRNIIQQIHDVNSGGNEARGILQFTPPTFKAFAVKGHKNIMNPYDQLLAFFNNSDWKNAIGMTTIWGHRKADWLHSGPIGHRRYANGGIVQQNQMVEVAEHNDPEAIIPMSLTRRSRGWELIGKVAASFAAQNGAPAPTATEESNNDYVTRDQFDTLLNTLNDFMNMVAQKPSGISERQVYNAYNRQKGRQYQLDSIKKG